MCSNIFLRHAFALEKAIRDLTACAVLAHVDEALHARRHRGIDYVDRAFVVHFLISRATLFDGYGDEMNDSVHACHRPFKAVFVVDIGFDDLNLAGEIAEALFCFVLVPNHRADGLALSDKFLDDVVTEIAIRTGHKNSHRGSISRVLNAKLSKR